MMTDEIAVLGLLQDCHWPKTQDGKGTGRSGKSPANSQAPAGKTLVSVTAEDVGIEAVDDYDDLTGAPGPDGKVPVKNCITTLSGTLRSGREAVRGRVLCTRWEPMPTVVHSSQASPGTS